MNGCLSFEQAGEAPGAAERDITVRSPPFRLFQTLITGCPVSGCAYRSCDVRERQQYTSVSLEPSRRYSGLSSLRQTDQRLANRAAGLGILRRACGAMGRGGPPNDGEGKARSAAIAKGARVFVCVRRSVALVASSPVGFFSFALGELPRMAGSCRFLSRSSKNSVEGRVRSHLRAIKCDRRRNL